MKARRFTWRRGATMALAAGLMFALAGDRGRAAIPPGIDPLEVLNLQIKPNVMFVLDSSGSMQETIAGNDTTSGDATHSKMRQAKDVLTQVIQQNETKAAFLFGQYTEANSSLAASGLTRFVYSTTDPAGNVGATGRAFSAAFPVTVTATNNRVYYEEYVSGGALLRTCGGTVAVGGPYTVGTTLATNLQTAMNGAACVPTARQNTYSAATNGNNGFTISRSAGTRTFRILSPGGVNPIASTLGFDANTGTGTNFASDLRIVQRTGNYDPPDPPTGPPNPVRYQLRSRKFFNGQRINVDSGGNVCSVTAGAGGTGAASFVEFRRNTGGGCGTSGPVVRFDFDGGNFNGNTVSCGGFQIDAPLTPCDQTSPTQLSLISPFIATELLFNASSAANCQGAVCPIQGYREGAGGIGDFFYTGPSWSEPTPGGIRATGSTPIIQTILDVKGLANNLPATPARPQRNFAELWFNGLGPVQAISLHSNPKEETILIFVTDGNATCSSTTGTGANATRLALGAAFASEQLFRRLDAAEPSSSVRTYVVNYGNGAQTTLSNFIAWGGSGMTSTMVASVNGGIGAVNDDACTSTAVGGCGGGTAATIPASPTVPPVPAGGSEFIRWAIGPTSAQKDALCPGCIDSFSAPDAATLAAVLDAIINQGATTGEFSAQQSITGIVYEYVNLIAATPPTGTASFDPANPGSRYAGFVPTRILSTFDLPGFKGQLKAFTDTQPADGVAELRWSAGDKLLVGVQAGMAAQCAGGQCTFGQLHGGATDANVETSGAAIKRRIYTTSQNGYFGLTVNDLVGTPPGSPQSPFRVPLWPPTLFNVAPATGAGLFDVEMGLTPANYPDTLAYQTAFHACKGVGPSGPVDAAGSGHPCSSSNAALQYATSTKEAREMILAFTAGAEFVKDINGDPVRALVPAALAGQILFQPRSWMLAESTLSTPAVVSPPLPLPNSEPEKHKSEYKTYVDGPRNAGGVNTASSQGIRAGFGLRNPDLDTLTPQAGSPPVIQVDPRTDLKPVMTVVYAGSNALLYAFRAGPCTGSPTCTETGGEELWAFGPYDQLDKLRLRFLRNPQGRDPHDYSIASSIRFGDVYVHEDPLNPTSVTPVDLATFPSGLTVQGTGVWRKVLYFGRGIGGKYVTAIDVTAPGLYTDTALSTTGPLVLWSRGNPDTVDGTPAGTPVNAPDTVPYSKMGQTWSVPAIGYVDPANNFTTRRPQGVEFVVYLGSGFSDVAGEGTTFYTLDAVTGDVVGSPDTETAVTLPNMVRSNLPFPNALVANPASFVGERFKVQTSLHPAGAKTTRVYFGDVHGRLWKLLSAFPNTLLPVADLGADDIDLLQPTSSAVSLLGLPASGDATTKPFIFVESGNDNRVADTVTFKLFAFRDNGTDTDNGSYSGTATGGITVFPTSELIFQDVFPAGFRGTVQPTSAFGSGGLNGVVFYGGTRFNPAGSANAPPPFPCRSSFDSVVFGLNAETGGAAFDLGGTGGNDPYVIFQDSRVIGLSIIGDPTNPTGQRLSYDEGLRKPGVPETPPPQAGVPTPTIAASNSVAYSILPTSPLPMVRLGSTVCQ